MVSCSSNILLLLLMNLLLFVQSDTGSVQMDTSQADEILRNNEVVFVNFYADWCRFSQMLKPVFESASDKVYEEFPESGRVVMAKVDCDREGSLAQRFHISKYPTLKLFRGGEMVKREYRGQRSVEAISAYIRDQLKDTIVAHSNMEEIDSLEDNNRNVIGYFADKESVNYKNFAHIASRLRDDCTFHVAMGDVSAQERTSGDTIMFRPPNTKHEDVVYMGQATQYDALSLWMNDKCVPLVREITFENAEGLTEEGLPFLILFHNLEDTESPKIYEREVAKQLIGERNNVNFLRADGLKFSHPLHHLGKHTNDLPVLAIDSFRHMYIFPHDVKTGLQQPGLLKQFIADLHSGQLHREFHEGPKPTPPTPPPQQQGGQQEHTLEHVPKTVEQKEIQEEPVRTDPPESTFKKLAPSRNRYTLLKDEL